MGIDVRAVFHLLLSQLHIQPLGLPVGVDYGYRRNQHSPSAKPATGFHRKVADSPSLVVEIEVVYNSQFAVCSLDGKILQMLIR